MTDEGSSRVSRREFVLAGAAAAWAAVPAWAQSTATTSGGSRDPALLTLKQASDLVRRRDISPVELTQACLARIDRHDQAINAFITVTRDQALAAARETEAELSPEWFHGCRIVGLSAGASTPDWVIEGVATWIRSLRSQGAP